jgi:hypothetical protein
MFIILEVTLNRRPQLDPLYQPRTKDNNTTKAEYYLIWGNRRKLSSSSTLSITYQKWTALGQNLGFRGEKLATE